MPHIRNIAVGLPLRDGHVLVLEGYDRVRDLGFYRAIGGGIEFGETAEAALHREFQEELGCRLDVSTLLGVTQNILEYVESGSVPLFPAGADEKLTIGNALSP